MFIRGVTMIPMKIECKNCGADLLINSWRKFVNCPYCKSIFDFEGFQYKEIDINSSMLPKVKYEMDCPNCRGKHMFLGTYRRKCFDCGYSISIFHKIFGVFWFCDNCETFMNVQKGFTVKKGTWTCTECGFNNSVKRKDIW